jgi:hypothetical protein
MKPIALPTIPVDPALRELMEQVLAQGETLDSFVDVAVREQVRRRLQQAEFIERGLVSADAVRQGGATLSLDEAMQALRQRIEQAGAKAAEATLPAGLS